MEKLKNTFDGHINSIKLQCVEKLTIAFDGLVASIKLLVEKLEAAYDVIITSIIMRGEAQKLFLWTHC